MFGIITTFYVSLAGIIVMLLLKRNEINTGHPSIVSRLGKSTDHAISTSYAHVRQMISYINKKTFIVVAQWIAYHVLLRIRKVYVEAKSRALANPHSRKVIDAVRGRGDVKRHGASFYLRRISDK